MSIVISNERLAERLKCDPVRGKLFWKARPASDFDDGVYSAERKAACWNTQFAGRDAFTARNSYGYLTAKFDGFNLTAHRVIWQMTHGEPADIIDHIDGDPTNNRISNLRSVTQSENQKNMRRPRNNTSGCVGVYFHRHSGLWAARIRQGDKFHSLGYHKTYEQAKAARIAGQLRFGFHPNHGRP